MSKQQVILGAFADEAGSSLKEQIAAMLDNGIQHLEARNIDGRNFIDHTVAEAKEIRAQLDAHGLRVWSIGSPLGKIAVTDPMQPHLDKLKHTLELAAVMGSERIRMFSFFIPKAILPPAAMIFCAACRSWALFLTRPTLSSAGRIPCRPGSCWAIVLITSMSRIVWRAARWCPAVRASAMCRRSSGHSWPMAAASLRWSRT